MLRSRETAKLLFNVAVCLVTSLEIGPVSSQNAIAQSEFKDCPQVDVTSYAHNPEADGLPPFSIELPAKVGASELECLSTMSLGLGAFLQPPVLRESFLMSERSSSTLELDHEDRLKMGSLNSLPDLDDRCLAEIDPESAQRATSTASGGLWISGDVDTALRALRWIAGFEDSQVLYVENGGQVRLSASLLGQMAGVGYPFDPASRSAIASFVSSREGLLLIVQLVEGKGRYLLHVGSTGSTTGGPVEINGEINLDNRFDRRINPRRPHGKKAYTELPPKGFDDLVAVNAAARWYNLKSNQLVPFACIVFHELAEAYGKVELGLQYLATNGLPGAHDLAVEREMIFRRQRPFSGVILTAGFNRIFNTEIEWREFLENLSVKSRAALRRDYPSDLSGNRSRPTGLHPSSGQAVSNLTHNTASSPDKSPIRAR